jgi:hypothetical protein
MRMLVIITPILLLFIVACSETTMTPVKCASYNESACLAEAGCEWTCLQSRTSYGRQYDETHNGTPVQWTVCDMPVCMPKICAHLGGYGLVGGDLLTENYLLCIRAAADEKIEWCDPIRDSDSIEKDACKMAYVQATQNISVCDKLSNKSLRRECKGLRAR